MERSVNVRFRTLRILIAVRPHTERVRIARPEEISRRIVQRQQRQSRLPAATKLSRSDMDVVVVLEGIKMNFLGRAAIPHQLRAPRQVRSFVVALTRAVAAGVAAGVAVATSRCVGAAVVTGVVTGNVAAGVAAGGAAGVATFKAALVAVTVAAGIAPEGPKAAALVAVNVAAGGAAIPVTEGTERFPPVAGGVARAVAGFVTVRVARAPVQLPPIACVVGSVRDRRLVRREGRGLVVPREPPAIDCGERHREVDKHRNSWSFHRPVEGLMTKL